MAFSSQFLDELRLRAGLADIIGRRVRLTRKGREHSGLCPFHKEKTPSFTVNEEKGFYHCFGCGAHGSVIDFAMQTEGLNFPEAVRKLAADAGMTVPDDTPEAREKERRRQGVLDVTEAAAAFFEKMLRMPEGRGALDYLKGRGLSGDTIKTFRLGFAPPGYGGLKGELSRAGISEDQMVEAGLLIQPQESKEGDKKPYDRFRGRVMFPITDTRSRVIAFGGRILGDGEPKYLNSPETPLFHKGRVLYGQAQASAAARKAGTVVVAEGYMDVIALHQAGFKHAVAPLGTALTEDQLAMLWRLVPEPVLCFDGDNAGRRAAARAAERALPGLKPGRGLRFASPPAGEDPDSLIAAGGPDAFARVLAEAEPISEVLWRMEAGTLGTGTPEARSTLQKRLEDHARRIVDPTVRSHFINTFKDRVWNAARSGNKAQGGHGRHRRMGGPSVMAPVVQDRAGPAYRVDSLRDAQQTLIAIIINHPHFFQSVEEQFGSIGFGYPPLDRLRQELVSLLSGDPGFDMEALKSALRERGLSETLDALYSDAMIRRHRRIRPGAENDEVRETWDENLEKLRRAALRAELEGEALPDAPTDEDLRRRMALKRAELGEE